MSPGRGGPASGPVRCRPSSGNLPATSPARLGSFAVIWIVPFVREQIQGTGQRHYADTIQGQLHRLGWVGKRTRYVLDPKLEKTTADSPKDPAFAAAQRALG